MRLRIPLFCILAWAATLQAQTITSVYGEAGTSSPLSPGGIAFTQGTNLGTSTAIVVTAGTRQAYVFNTFGGTALQLELPVDAPLGATTIKAGASAPFNITLVPFSPGLPVNGTGGPATAFHASGAPVTASFPATPNEQISLQATGLGPTNPVFPTGTTASDTSAVAVTLPTVSVAGKPATVQTAFLSPNNSPGFYVVVFTMRADVTTGNRNTTISIGGLTSNTLALPVSTGPVISSVTNAASYTSVGPGKGIAQGAIFVIKGLNMGPAAISIAPDAFQSTSLGGTSVAVTVGVTTVAALMYYTSAGQIAAMLPSNTPVGAGTVTVTYNNQAGPASPIVIVANTLGIFTVTSDGNGAGIVTYPDYSLVSTTKAANSGGVNATCGAANPGDVLTIWATGLGAVSGSDASGAGLGVNMTSIPLTIWLGNVQVTAAYQGRSGCCIGEDQIVFTVPANTPTGCNVPLSVPAGSFVSNSVALPVAPAGSRTCTPADATITAANLLQVNSGNTFAIGSVRLRRLDNHPGFQDVVQGQFLRASVPSGVQPFFFSYIDIPALGTCQVSFYSFDSPNGPSPPFTLQPLDAGPQITVQGPNGSKNVSGSAGSYQATLSGTGTCLSPGTYTVSSAGGADVPAFRTSIAIPALPVMTSPPPDAANPFSVTRANGLTVTWSGGLTNGYIELDGFGSTDNTGANGITFQCSVAANSGTFTIPRSVLLAFPAGNFGGSDFQPAVSPANLTGTGLTVAQLTFEYENFASLAFK